MRFFIILLNGFLLVNCCIFVLASYEPYGPSHQAASGSSYVAQSPIGQGWNSGQQAGSYYHYHVPLVGQNSHYQHPPPAPANDVHHTLLWLIPLLLLAIAPLALLPLLMKFLLIPLGLSLLALLAPLLMMGMMMMMMMMGGMMMPMMMRSPQSLTSVQSARQLGQMLVNDWSSILTTASRSIDVDQCPEKLACHLGSLLYATDNSTINIDKGELLSKYIVEQFLPRGKVKKTIRFYKDAFWTGSKSQDCSAFNCQPALRFFGSDKTVTKSTESKKSDSIPVKVGHGTHLKYSRSNSTVETQTAAPTYIYSIVNNKKQEIVAES